MRTETDLIGSCEIADDALYGIHALRAAGNFPGSIRFNIHWYKATGMIKQACYRTAAGFFQKAAAHPRGKNFNPGSRERYPGDALPEGKPDQMRILAALEEAAGEVAAGLHFDSFIVPAVQGGAGTSINMNINEIIANVALLKLGSSPGCYGVVDPVEDANIFQSTNDVIPTALKVAAMTLLRSLEEAVNHLRQHFESLEARYRNVLRIGYTQMQEAVPSSFGKLFSTYSDALSRDWWRISRCFERIKEVNLGGGAIGTGLSIPRFFIMHVTETLRQLSGFPVTRSENPADTTANLDPLVEIHAILKAHAVNLEKIAADLRLLSSDLANPPPPHSHAPVLPHLLKLPPRQAGSSIMPGKVNPVIPEFVISASHQVCANDQLISGLAAQGCLELNAYLPQIGHALLQSLELLTGCCATFRENMTGQMEVNPATGPERLWRSPSVTTALIPYIGYHRAGELAALMKQNGCSIFEAGRLTGLAGEELLKQVLQPDNLLKLGFSLDELS